MPPLTMEPIIVEPEDLSARVSDPKRGRFILYDTDFPVETDPRYAVEPGVPPLAVPHFGVGEVASIAFAGQLDWLKHQLKGKPYRAVTGERKSQPLLLGGEQLEFRSVARGGVAAPKRYTLPDIERLACALFERGDIDGHELQRVCQILLAIARQYWARTKKRES